MHPHLTHAAWFGIFAASGLVVFLLIVGPEIRWQRRWTPESMQDPEFWFWITIVFGFCVGIAPYVLAHAVSR